MTGEDRRGPSDRTLWAAAGEFTGLGLTWALSVLLFLLGGWWLDGRLGTTPLFTFVGAFVGAGAGFYSLWQHVVVEPRERERSDESDDDPEHEEGRG